MTITNEDRMMGSAHLSEDEKSVIILDQTQLPNRTEYLTLGTAKEVYDAIKILAVRGAPAIGICAAYGMYVIAQQKADLDPAAFAKEMHEDGAYINSSRPTAVNLSWAIKRMLGVVDKGEGKPVAEIISGV